MKTIVCDISLFDINQVISALDDTGSPYFAVSSTLQDLGKDIVELCVREHTARVHLFGSEVYLNEAILPTILEYSKNYYQLNNIEVEIN